MTVTKTDSMQDAEKIVMTDESQSPCGQPLNVAKESSTPLSINSLLSRAMRLLSQRDHSEAELRRKLVQRSEWHNPPLNNSQRCNNRQTEIDPDLIQQVIDYCYQHNYLDDERFAHSYIHNSSAKGHGPQRIRADLLRKGVSKQLIEKALFDSDIDWCHQARTVVTRKFGATLPTEWKEKAKMQRYLLGRGFSYEEIQSIYHDFDE